MIEERKFVVRSQFVLTNLLSFVKTLLPSNDLVWEVIIRPFVEKRSSAANARLWALHTLAGKETGYSTEEMHEHALCRHFGFTERKVVDLFTGEILTKRDPIKRSSQRNRKEFGEFMESTEAWYISEFGVWLDQESAPAEPLRKAA